MDNKKGFTIVEVTISLVILLLISLFVAGRVIDYDKSSKEKIYKAKQELAINAAIKYGNDIVDSLTDECTPVSIGTLISLKYLTGEDEYSYSLINPLTNESMNNEIICVCYSSKVMAELRGKNELCS